MVSKIDTRPVGEKVYDYLLEEIIQGRIPKGEIINTRDVAAELDVSESPVRVALQKLQHQGILEITPRSKCRVVRPTQKTIADMFEVRRLLEVHAISQIYSTIESEQFQRLSDFVNQMGQLLEDTDLGSQEERYARYLELDHSFHEEICRMAKNSFIERFHRETHLHLAMSIAFSFIDYSTLKLSHRDHQHILENLEKRSSDAVESLTYHLDRIETMVLDSEVYRALDPE